MTVKHFLTHCGEVVILPALQREPEAPFEEAQVEIGRLLARLTQLVDDAPFEASRIEARAGLERGQLVRLLDRRLELRYHQLLAVLEVLAVSPDAFFASLYPARERASWRAGRSPGSGRVALPAAADVASVYGFGVESLRRLRRRLERCELALARLQTAEVRTEGYRPTAGTLRSER